MKLKLNWGILQDWSSGRKEDAINSLRGIKKPQNDAMKYGSKLHDIVSSKKSKLLPFMADSAIFENIVPEQHIWQNFFSVDMSDVAMFDVEVRGVVDVYDPVEGYLIDWKTGKYKSNEQNPVQAYYYAYLLSKQPQPINIKWVYMAKIEEVEEGVVLCNDYSQYKVTEKKLEVAEEYIISNASEIYAEFTQDNE